MKKINISNFLYNICMMRSLKEEVNDFDDGASLEKRYTSMRLIFSSLGYYPGAFGFFLVILGVIFRNDFINTIILSIVFLIILPIIFVSLYLSFRLFPTANLYHRSKNPDSIIMLPKSANFYNCDYIISIVFGLIIGLICFSFFV